MENPESVFDILFIGDRIEAKLNDFGSSELHFFSYLSCLLSLYDGNSINDWRYGFIKSELGSPYSNAIQRSIDKLSATGYLSKNNEYFRISSKGKEYLEFYSHLFSFSQRIKYLKAATQSLSLIPIGYIKEGLRNEPGLKSARNTSSKRILLDDNNPSTKVLYEHFKNLRLALEDKYESLLAPAVVWIESLNQPTSSVNA